MDLSVSFVILAGGLGKRLGGIDKGLIRHRDGTTLLHNLLDGMRHVASESLLVIRQEQSEQFQPFVDMYANEFPVRMVFDAGAGPAAALALAAKFATHECIIVTGADHPHFDIELVSRLQKAWANSQSNVIAARRHSKKGNVKRDSVHPLWAIYRRSAVVNAASYTDWSHRSLSDLVEHLGPKRIKCDSKAFMNINNPSDLHSFDCEIPNVDSH